jgi:transcriptional regulator with XRE-family HTH domain
MLSIVFALLLDFFDNYVITRKKEQIRHQILEVCGKPKKTENRSNFVKLSKKGGCLGMDDWVLRVAETLEKARAEAGISQATLSKRMGVSRQSVIKWEQGVNAISFPMMMKWFVGCGVSLERYLDSCIHPGLLERLEDSPTDKEKRRMLHEAIEECSAYEVDALLYIRYGAHGSDHIAVLSEMLANLHCPLDYRVSHCVTIINDCKMAKARGSDPDPNGFQPEMDILCQARDCGMAAAENMEDVYSINKEAIEDAKKKNEAR